MSNPSKVKGSKAERDVVLYLSDAGLVVERIPAGATADRGDLWLEGSEMPTIDVKDRARLELAAWVDRADEQAMNSRRPYGVVWHKRKGKGSPSSWYVTLSGAAFVEILHRLRRSA